MEEWKIIEEFPIYSVSNYGRIKNNISNYILVGGYDKDGYRQVTLCYNKKQYNRRICRLVAQAFIPNPNNLPVVNHKDEIKSNDYFENLEWCTIAYNNTYGINNPQNSRSKKVKCVETKIEYSSIRQAASKTNILRSKIAKACQTHNTINGYHWEYI